MSSLVVWLLIIVFGVDVISRVTTPVRDAKGYEEKLSTFFQSGAHPDLLLIGSSVALSSSFESDAAAGILADRDRKHTYLGAAQLAHSIEATTGKRLEAANLACFGAMADYAWMVTRKLIEFKKVPKVIIYETVSRDLFDASMPRVYENPYYRCMVHLHPDNALLPAPVRRVFDQFMSQPLIIAASVWASDDETLRNPERLRFEFDAMIRALLNLYDQRVSICAYFTDMAACFLDRPSSLHSLALKNQIENKKKNPFAQLSKESLRSIEVDPTPQIQRFEEEKVYFLKLLKLCREEKIRLIVVNMPVRAEYENMVPTPLKKRWPSEIQALCDQFGFALIDLNLPQVFTNDNFIDTAHLNKKGSLKVNDLLSRELARRRLIDAL